MGKEIVNSKWMQYIRRNESNIFNALFFDIEPISNEDIHDIASSIAEFYGISIPYLVEKSESFAKILTAEDPSKCELHYNIELLKQAGINNADALTLCLVHEISHQLLFQYNFGLFSNERWIQELAADLMSGAYAGMKNLATGKFKYALSRQVESLTHPSGTIRALIVDYGRLLYRGNNKTSTVAIANDVLTFLPSFVFIHYGILKRDWGKVINKISHQGEPLQEDVLQPIELPDSNLIKQYIQRSQRG